MSFHLAAFFENITASSYSALDTVADGVLARTGSDNFVVDRNTNLIAAYAGGVNIEAARIVSPSFLKVVYPSIRPIENGTTPGTDPNVMRLIDRPLSYGGSDTLSVEVIQSGAATDVYALVWLARGALTPVPPGEAFWIRYTSSTAVTANAWSEITVNWPTLPEGHYAVCGMEHTCTSAVAARLNFYGTDWRPGTLAETDIENKTDRIFYDDSLGVWGTFPSFTPPGIEVLADAASTNHEGYIRVIKIS